MRKAKPLSLISGPYNQEGTQEVAELIGDSVFSFPKPVALVRRFFECVINGNDSHDGIYLDFFAGSSTSAHALMLLNAQDGGKRQFIMVQLPELCDEQSEAFKVGYKTIADIGKERIRRAGKKIKDEIEKMNDDKNPRLLEDPNTSLNISSMSLDVGFRVLKVDSSNMADVYYTPDAISQNMLLKLTHNIKTDRAPEDLLFQVLLDWGVDLSLPIAKEEIDGRRVFFVDGNALAACFDHDINEELVKKLAAHKPLRMVFRDAGFSSDSIKINVEQIFKLISPSTEVKTI